MNCFFDANYNRRIRYKNQISSIISSQTRNKFELKSNYKPALKLPHTRTEDYDAGLKEQVECEKRRLLLARTKAKHDIDRKHQNTINEWLSSTYFSGCSVAYITISLRDSFYNDKENCLIKTIPDKITCRFRREVNKAYFGDKAAKKLRSKNEGVRVHSWEHNEPQLHLHILCEIPEKNFDRLAKFVKQFEILLKRIITETFIEPAKSVSASIKYNGRYGEDSVLDF